MVMARLRSGTFDRCMAVRVLTLKQDRHSGPQQGILA